ncbi:MAG: phosphohydrolase [Elusimicrobia bacterium RIFOXYC2_FULL_34_12]|nr:MAG: phosphohydrolase [Elusimicrobia bacterium RIFOXYC2_FULL_34_12]OGS37891.1 MAG: phosphohydrolase [Elusimicrobia bacterium RIFOXYD2_FULL_34_30]HAM37953.1 phosphohydrolase [Elusimicrobiota bacterium]
MFDKCPGQSSRNIKVSIHICSYCGHEVEMFSDELRVKCPKCKQFIYKEKVPSCIEWCKAARECLGEERWQKMQEILKKGEKDESKRK